MSDSSICRSVDVFSRRAVLGAVLATPIAPALAGTDTSHRFTAPKGARELMVDVPGARLWCWDSGGSGTPLLLLHPATGSAAIWEYQYDAFVRAGYRVAAFSRRGHYRTEFAEGADVGFAIDDIDAVVNALGFGRFFLLGSAAGGFQVPDYALSHPDRLRGIVIACSQGGAQDPVFREAISRVLPKGFSEMPASFRELGPSYRATDPTGMARWEALEQSARTGGRVRQRARNVLDWPSLSRIKLPTLFVAGGADLYMPPALTRIYASHIAGSRVVNLPECGHSAYWEQPEAFNKAVIGFLKSARR